MLLTHLASACRSLVQLRTEFREVARLADISGAYVRVYRSVPHVHGEDERPRRGQRCELGLSKHDFIPVISSRAKYKAHSGSLEATGLSLTVRWVLRDLRRHSKRLVVLVDAQAVLGAAARGRSSAKTIKREIRRYGALALGGDLLIRLVYIPSEDNPGDTPSRNKPMVKQSSNFDRNRLRRARLSKQAQQVVKDADRCPGCGVAAAQHPAHAPKRLRRDYLLSDDSVAPTNLSQVYGLATDDLIVFT